MPPNDSHGLVSKPACHGLAPQDVKDNLGNASSSLMTELAYDVLDENDPSIRLLRRAPSEKEPTGEELMSFSLETRKLSENPTYTALSYSWGSPFYGNSVIEPESEHFTDEERRQQRELEQRDWHSAQHAIVCNGSTVHVRLNLFEALSRLSRQDDWDALWIDALCINQASPAEKESQIRLMGRIYRQAGEVVVWLGVGGCAADGAADLVAQFDPLIESRPRGLAGSWKASGGDYDAIDYRRWGIGASRSSAAFLPRRWAAFAELCGRSWFSRRWTLQEAALARRVRVACGARSFALDRLEFLAHFMSSARWRGAFGGGDDWFGGVDAVNGPWLALVPVVYLGRILGGDRAEWRRACAESYGGFGPAVVLVDLLYRCLWLWVTEPSDVVFAIYNLVPALAGEGLEALIPVDYSVGAPELFRRVAEVCVCNVPSLALLNLVRDDCWRCLSSTAELAPEDQMPELPSWVPRLAASAAGDVWYSLGLEHEFLGCCPFSAAFRQGAAPARRVAGDSLYLRGHYLGAIDCCTSRSRQSFRDYIRFLDNIPSTVRGVAAIEALWRSYIQDVEDWRHPASPDFGKCFHDYILAEFVVDEDLLEAEIEDRCSSLSNTAEKLNTKDYRLPAVSPGDPVYQHLVTTGAIRRSRDTALPGFDRASAIRFGRECVQDVSQQLFRTDGGDVGCGALSQRLGDQVWLLENGRTPFLLRPCSQGYGKETSKKTFILLKECFVYGIMSGELMRNQNLEYEEICIV